MKRQWRVRRQFVPYPDGEPRWDRAFQYLLQWAVNAESHPTATPPSSMLFPQEVDHADRSVRTGFNPKPNSTAND